MLLEKAKVHDQEAEKGVVIFLSSSKASVFFDH